MTIINLNKIAQAKLNKTPYHYGKINGMFDSNLYLQLCNDYPKVGFTHCEALSQDKTYSMYMRQLCDTRKHDIDIDDLSESWSLLVRELKSKAYLQTLSDHAQHDLSQCDVEINCWQYASGGWLSPHTDKPEKVISQLFYFNEQWQDSWGGQFHVLNSENEDDIHETIYPDENTSVILVRSNNSWHSVAPLSCPSHITRRLVQIIYWKK